MVFPCKICETFRVCDTAIMCDKIWCMKQSTLDENLTNDICPDCGTKIGRFYQQDTVNQTARNELIHNCPYCGHEFRNCLRTSFRFGVACPTMDKKLASDIDILKKQYILKKDLPHGCDFSKLDPVVPTNYFIDEWNRLKGKIKCLT